MSKAVLKGVTATKSVTSIRIGDNLWRAARVYAIKNGVSLTQLIERLLREELRKDPELLKMVERWP
jgi:predicted HicB family RNase H-like nuclease